MQIDITMKEDRKTNRQKERRKRALNTSFVKEDLGHINNRNILCTLPIFASRLSKVIASSMSR